METPFDPSACCSTTAAADAVVLADGARIGLGGLTRDELLALQWQQERQFARRILAAVKDSPERAAAIGQAYDTVTRVLTALRGRSGGPLTMGLHPRYGRCVLGILRRQQSRGASPRFFEIGYGSGLLLKQVHEAGFPVAGIEVSERMQQEARRLLPPDAAGQVLLGNFVRDPLDGLDGRVSVVYWNDVFEHIPPDELPDYLRRIRRLLAPGGQLLTITPNWHMRPLDITRAFFPPRTEAAGLHLKEYTLGEVRRLLSEAGFRHIATPLCVTRQRIVLAGRGLASWKCAVEGLLERLPFSLARLLCRGLGLSMTIARQPRG